MGQICLDNIFEELQFCEGELTFSFTKLPPHVPRLAGVQLELRPSLEGSGANQRPGNLKSGSLPGPLLSHFAWKVANPQGGLEESFQISCGFGDPQSALKG